MVVVFGITIATFNSLNASAKIGDVKTIRCVAPYTSGCVKVATADGGSHWLTGKKTVTP